MIPMSEPTTTLEPAPQKTESRGFAYWLATAGGLGLLPLWPGTWGSLAGLALAWLFTHTEFTGWRLGSTRLQPFNPLAWWFIVSAAGVWAAGSVARASGKKDPQHVVVDEVSGQWLAQLASPAFLAGTANWKSYLVGFILFRAFDIFKPFPARQAESLPGGWGIMADDWVAGAYAAAWLWLARGFGF
jgi:phosphatidylglycerophosphatase A